MAQLIPNGLVSKWHLSVLFDVLRNSIRSSSKLEYTQQMPICYNNQHTYFSGTCVHTRSPPFTCKLAIFRANPGRETMEKSISFFNTNFWSLPTIWMLFSHWEKRGYLENFNFTCWRNFNDQWPERNGSRRVCYFQPEQFKTATVETDFAGVWLILFWSP